MSKHHHLYNNSRWKAKRLAQLSADPLCWMHLKRGETVIATIADHHIPHRGNLNKFWHGELRSLCKQCHDSDKKRIESGNKPKPVYNNDGFIVNW